MRHFASLEPGSQDYFEYCRILILPHASLALKSHAPLLFTIQSLVDDEEPLITSLRNDVSFFFFF